MEAGRDGGREGGRQEASVSRRQVSVYVGRLVER